MNSPHPFSQFSQLAAEVNTLDPGECLTMDNRDLAALVPAVPGGAGWTLADRILEIIVGSGYEFYSVEDKEGGTTTFHRLAEPLSDGRRSYVSPDQRHHFTQDAEGFYRPNK